MAQHTLDHRQIYFIGGEERRQGVPEIVPSEPTFVAFRYHARLDRRRTQVVPIFISAPKAKNGLSTLRDIKNLTRAQQAKDIHNRVSRFDLLLCSNESSPAVSLHFLRFPIDLQVGFLIASFDRVKNR
jgi:hypothetical protein